MSQQRSQFSSRRSKPSRHEKDTEPARQHQSVTSHRAALEALFAPKTPTAQQPDRTTRRDGARLVTSSTMSTASDPQRALREKLLATLLNAEGRRAISQAADSFLGAGFSFPHTQEVHLQLLEHTSEERVRESLQTLSTLLDGEPARRKTVLDSRLRRLEDSAEEGETRAHSSALRRKLASLGR